MVRPTENGFTLMEMVITLTLIATLAGIAVPFMGNGAQAYNRTADGLQTVDKLRYACERLARELREIQRDGIIDFSSNTIAFRKSDNVVVTIAGAAPALNMRYDTLGNTDFVLTDDLASITFNYYLDDGITTASNTGNVAYIEFEITLNNGNDYIQRTRVALRNRL